MTYAVIAPLVRLPRGRDAFDYLVPDELVPILAPGHIVDVPFRKRTIKGVVLRTHEQKPPFAVRPIKKILTPVPFLDAPHLALAKSIARTTATPLSIVLKSFLPVIKVRELATLILPEFKTQNGEPKKCTHTLLHWHDEKIRNQIYCEKAIAALKENQSVLIITAREPDITALQKVFEGMPVITVPPSNRTHHVWEAWKKARSGEPIVLIGLRSAIFAPIINLGLIIVDQEHDENLKQEEPNPRYHARTVAIERALHSGCELVLASPTPSLESYFATQNGSMKLTETELGTAPRIQLVNLDDEHKKDAFSFIAPDTITAIDETLAQQKSVFILVDRLGAATVLRCQDCGHEWKCPDCNAYLPLHEAEKTMRCQRCGFSTTPPESCPKCQGQRLKHGGAGTERIANLAAYLKPTWPIIRLDSLTATKAPPQSLDLTKPSVIIGTRFALAHLNTASLGLTISLTTDQLLSRPEFRTHESTYRILSDMARRSGHLIAYTHDPQHWVLQALTKTYGEFYNEEVRIRERWGYPPFATLTRLILQDPSKTVLTKRAKQLSNKLTTTLPHITKSEPYDLQPARVRGRWRMGILIKEKALSTLPLTDWTRIIDADTIVDVQPNSIT